MDLGQRQVLSLAETALVLDMGVTTAYDLIRRGEFPIPVMHIGGRIKVSRVILERYLAGELHIEAS